MPPLWYTDLEKLNGWRLKDRHSVQLFQLSSPLKSDEVYPLLMDYQLPPHGHDFVVQQWCQQPPKVFIYRLLEQGDTPISAQILALKLLTCRPEPQDLKILWTVFFESRFGVRAEDPDLFERALDIIIEIEKSYPRSSQALMSQDLPELFARCLEHRERANG